MRHAALVAALVALPSLPAIALSPTASATISTYEAVVSDPARLKTFCEMIQFAATTEIDGKESIAPFLDKLGNEFRKVWADEMATESDPRDNELIDAAIRKLYVACDS